MQLQEIQDNIKSRRNKIFLLMEEVSSNVLIVHIISSVGICLLFNLEVLLYSKSNSSAVTFWLPQVRRLRVQQRIKSLSITDENGEQENEMPDIPSSIPFLPHVVSHRSFA